MFVAVHSGWSNTRSLTVIPLPTPILEAVPRISDSSREDPTDTTGTWFHMRQTGFQYGDTLDVR